MDLPLVAFDLGPLERARVKLYLRAQSLEAYEQIGRMCTLPCADDFRPTTVAMYDAPLVTRRPFIAVHLDASKSAAPPKRAVYSLPVFELAASRARFGRISSGDRRAHRGHASGPGRRSLVVRGAELAVDPAGAGRRAASDGLLSLSRFCGQVRLALGG